MDTQHAGGATAGLFPHRCRPTRYGVPHFPHPRFPRLTLVLVLLLIVVGVVVEEATDVPVLAAGELLLALLTVPLLTARQMAGPNVAVSPGGPRQLARGRCLWGWRHGTA